MGARQSVTTAGFVTTANKDALYLIEVKASDLPDGYPFVRLKTVENVNDPVVGEILVILSKGPSCSADNAPTAIA